MPVSNSNQNPVHAALLNFAKLGEPGRDKFISRMNEFLLASPKRRKSMQSHWAGEQRETAASLHPFNDEDDQD